MKSVDEGKKNGIAAHDKHESPALIFSKEKPLQNEHSNLIPHFAGLIQSNCNQLQFDQSAIPRAFVAAPESILGPTHFFQNMSFDQTYAFGTQDPGLDGNQQRIPHLGFGHNSDLGQLKTRESEAHKITDTQPTPSRLHSQQHQEYEDDDDADNNAQNSSSERAGRWTKEEHEIFLNAIKKYGKEWKKVAALIKTRTVVQTRTHAQKYFQKLNKGGPSEDDSATGSAAESSGKSGKRARRVQEDNSGKKAKAEQEVDLYSGDDDFGDDGDYDSESATGDFGFRPTAAEQIAIPGPRISIPTVAMVAGHFPLPSPAACGSRKKDELAAAQMLAGSSAQDIDGVQMLVGLRSGSQAFDGHRSTGEGTLLRSRGGASLSIINPSVIGCFVHDDTPETPWEGELRALGEFGLPTGGSHVASGPTGPQSIATIPDVDVTLIFDQLKALVLSGDVEGLAAALKSRGEGQVPPNDGNFSSGRRNTGLALVLNRRDSTSRGMTLVMFACELAPEIVDEGKVLQLCSLLVEYGASVGDFDILGWSSLHRAARFGYASVGHFLLSKGCYANAIGPNGDTAMHVAAKAGQEKFLRMLCNLGANPHVRNMQGQAAIDLVAIDMIVNPKTAFSQSTGRNSDRERHLEYQEYLSSRANLRQVLLQAEPRLRTLVLYHEDCLAHTARQPTDWEQPDRLREIMKAINDTYTFQANEIEVSSAFKKAGVEILSRVHSAEYITLVNDISKTIQDEYDMASSRGQPKPAPLPFTPQVQKFVKHFDGNELKAADTCDTAFSAGTLRAARRAAGAVAHAIDMILLGRNRNAFCIVRPPGHHAGYSGLLDGGKSCGFCIFNNVGAGALHALEFHKIDRVAIIDLDIHHGNGTEDIVRRYGQPSRLFFFSLHLFDKGAAGDASAYEFFPGTGAADDTSPSPVLVGREAYRQAISQRLLPSLRAFNPDLILLSTGFDAAHGDLGNIRFNAQPNTSGSAAGTHVVRERGMDLTPADFEWVTTEVLRVADLCCAGRVVSVLEGGYGEYAKTSKSSLRNKASSVTSPTTAVTAEDESLLDRDSLVSAAVAHLRRLVDPYGPSVSGSRPGPSGRSIRVRSPSESSGDPPQPTRLDSIETGRAMAGTE